MYIILDDGTVEIKTYMGDASEVIIPNTIDGKKSQVSAMKLFMKIKT